MIHLSSAPKTALKRRTDPMTDQRRATYVRQSKILIPETEKELFHRRKDGDSGKYAGRAFVFQSPAPFTRHQIGTVERAIKVFLELGLVEILTDGAYYMADIQLLIGQSSTKGERKKKERMRLKRQKLRPSGAGQPKTKRKPHRRVGTGITAYRREKPYDRDHRRN